VADVAEAMEGDSQKPVEELRVDGGAAVDDLLMQIQSDLLGVPVMRPAITETTALGAGYLAGIAVGFWQGPEDLRSHLEAARYFTPRMDQEKASEARARWREAVERSKHWSEAKSS